MIKKILGFLKKEKKVIEVNKKDLKNKSEEIFNTYVENNIKQPLTENEKEINKIVKEIKQNEKIMQESKDKLINLPTKEKQYITGNMKNLIVQINIFLNSLKVPKEYDKISEYHLEFKKNIFAFQQNTARSKHIIHHFLEKEVSEIHNKIFELNKIYKQSSELINNQEFKDRYELKKLVALYEKEKSEKKELNENIKQSKTLIDKIKKQKNENLNKIQQIKSSKKYEINEDLKKQLYFINEKIKHNHNTISTDFSMLERPLKKFKKISLDFEKTINDYITDPFLAFISDNNQEGKVILRNIKFKIETNEIEIKNKDKTIKKINEIIQDEYWDKKIKTTNSLNKEKEYIENKLKQNDVEKEIIESQNEMKSLDLKIEEENNTLKILNDKLVEKSKHNHLDNIKTKFIDVLNCDVNINT